MCGEEFYKYFAPTGRGPGAATVECHRSLANVMKATKAGKDARAPQSRWVGTALHVRLSAHDDGIRKTIVNCSFVGIDQGISHAQAKERERENKTDGALD